MVSKSEPKAIVNRDPRLSAHVVANVRRFRWLKILSRDAQLIDMSEKGVKLAFSKDVGAEPSGIFWIEIPALTDHEIRSMVLKATCQWYDAERQILGAELLDLTDDESTWMREMIAALQKLGRTAI